MLSPRHHYRSSCLEGVGSSCFHSDNTLKLNFHTHARRYVHGTDQITLLVHPLDAPYEACYDICRHRARPASALARLAK